MAVHLPAELWDHVLSQLSPHDLQHTAHALALALPPHLHLSSALRSKHLRVTREGQPGQCIHAVRNYSTLHPAAVRTVSVELDDPQLLVNLVLALPNLRSISLSVGPLAAPEHLDDLLDTASLVRTKRWQTLEQLAFRFNPYVSERSYYTFLKGAYFDTAVHSLARTPPSSLPSLRRLSFAQDLPPLHGAPRKKEELAFGLHDLGDALDGVDVRSVVVPTSGKFGRQLKHGKMEFAQPIVFFQLSCLSTLALSPLGAQLTHLTFRLPRRNVLAALLDLPSPLSAPFPALRHLDLSTTHVVDDARLPTFLRMCPGLERLVLDRCSGLISAEAVDEPTAVATLRWLGKCCATIGLSRAEDAVRHWRRIQKARPTTSLPTPTSSSSAGPAPQVKDLVVLPPPTTLRSLGLGLHDLPASSSSSSGGHLRDKWARAFAQGYTDGTTRTREKAEGELDKWARWTRQGLVREGEGKGEKRMVCFRDGLEALGLLTPPPTTPTTASPPEDEDATFVRFCAAYGLVPFPASSAHVLLSALEAQPAQFKLCTTPSSECPNTPGVPHLSLSAAEGGKGEDQQERREKEKRAWESERRDWEERERRGGHQAGCAHEAAAREWGLEQFD
ncbi:hypothetical protein JCM10207_001051 [Rhodosporidiobolus poonsookiae]